MSAITNSEQAEKDIYKKQSAHIIKHLKKRNMDGVYYEDTKDAIRDICTRIPEGALVGLGGSETIIDSNLVSELRKLNIRLLDRYRKGITTEQINEMRLEGLLSDVFIASTNAITMDGKLVNQDGIGNRVACMIYGPKKVILLAGMNKVVKDIPEAISRIKTIAAPRDSIRVGASTPCSKTGVCQDPDCYPPNRICSQFVIIESSMTRDRILVVLVGEKYGF